MARPEQGQLEGGAWWKCCWGAARLVMDIRATSLPRSASTTTATLAQAKRLIDVAVLAGCEGVKFQKRTFDVVYTREELAKPRESPYGTTNGDLKRALEFGQEQYEQIHEYCRRQADCLDRIVLG